MKESTRNRLYADGLQRPLLGAFLKPPPMAVVTDLPDSLHTIFLNQTLRVQIG